MNRLYVKRICPLLILLLLAACYPYQLPPVIKIGLVAPFEGRYRYIGYDAIYAARLAVREINAAGGVGGWQLALVAYDDRATPEMAQTVARNLVIDPDVVAVIGHYQQITSASAQKIYADAEFEMPLLAMGAWLTRSLHTLWHFNPDPLYIATAMIDVAAWHEPAQAVTIWGEGPLADALAVACDRRGWHITSPNTAQTPAINFNLLPPDESARLLAERSTVVPSEVWLGGPNLAASEFAIMAGDAGDGVKFVTFYPFPQDLPDLDAWVTRYRAVGPHVPEPGPYALPTYEAIYTLAQAMALAIEAEGRPTREGIATALPTVQRSGALGSIRWEDNGFLRDAPLYLYRWEQEQPRLVRRFWP